MIAYVYSVHPNMSLVLSHYTSLGFVEVIPLSLPGEQPFGDTGGDWTQFYFSSFHEKDLSPLQHVARRDCFYRSVLERFR